MLTTYQVASELTSPQWCLAFQEGCRKDIPSAMFDERQQMLLNGPAAYFGSAKLWHLHEQAVKRAAEGGAPYYYGDHAYFNRMEYFRITKNAKQHTGLGIDKSSSRFETFRIQIKRWTKSGSHILLAPNSETFLGLHGYREGQWIEETTAAIRAVSDREIVRSIKKTDSWKNYAANAWAVVTFTSNTALEAVLEGIPAFCTAQCAASSLSLSDLTKIETPYYPDMDKRFDVACVLANNQFKIHEMLSGQAWTKIK